jgi:hypothetical protein
MGMRVATKRILGRVLVVALIAYVGFAALIGWAMRQPPETFGRVMKHMPDAVFLILPFETFWTHARAGTLHPGDPAPDFDLEKLDKTGRIQLASFNTHQPVVLVFGSYT